jgi:hypothetical protein
MNESRVLSPEFRSNISTLGQGRFPLGQGKGGCVGTLRFGGVDPSTSLRASRVTTCTSGDNCCDSRHMKAGGPGIWFYRLARPRLSTARTVGFDGRNRKNLTEWNETLRVCI